MASINEDIQNIALDNVDPDPILNDLSGGKVVAKETVATTSQGPEESLQSVIRIDVQQSSSSNQATSESNKKSSCTSPWMLSTSSRGDTFFFADLVHSKDCSFISIYHIKLQIYREMGNCNSLS